MNTLDAKAALARRALQLIYHVGTYHHSKSMPLVVACPSPDGYKTTAARRAEEVGGVWTHRAGGYLMNARKLSAFKSLMADEQKALQDALDRLAASPSSLGSPSP